LITSGTAFSQAQSCAQNQYTLSLRVTNGEQLWTWSLFAILSLAILFLVSVPAPAEARDEMGVGVTDALGRPLSRIALELHAQDGRTIAHVYTHQDGYARLPIAAPGVYTLIATGAHFKPASKLIVWPSGGASFALIMEAREALNVPISASRLHAQNGLSPTGNSKYTMTARDIANIPAGEAAPLNEVLLQMPGVALDQNQEIHIRGEHAGIQYQMNGILLPLDINNDPTFTQLLNSYFVSSVSLIDGVLPAQYGYRTSGVIAIQTKNGCDGGHNNFTLYGGMYDTAEPSFQLQGCNGRFSYYLTGLYLHSNLGLSSATPGHDPIHDAVNQGQGFTALTYELNPSTTLSFIGGITVADNDFPNRPGLPPLYTLQGVNPANYPPTAIDSSVDQQDYYGVLALNGAVGEQLDYQLAYALHYNTETFNPDPIGDLIYQGIAPQVFNSDLANTLQENTTYRLGSHTFGAGFYLGEYGVEADNTSQVFAETGVPPVPSDVPISVTANLNKINILFGFYLQDTWQITQKFSVNFGSRWDRADGFVNDSQFSPTINFVYKPRPDTTIHAGFARNFQVPNFQNISTNTSALVGTSGATGLPPSTYSTQLDAETDYTWDVGYTHQFTTHLQWAQDSYFRIDRHYIDEGQFGFVPLDAPFNYVRGYGAGIENTLTYNLRDFSLRATAFVAREEVRGVATGQYNFPPLGQLEYIDNHYIILDHTPLLGMSGGMAYQWRDYKFMIDGLYSSGLRGGFANTDLLPVVWQVNLGAVRKFELPGLGELENRITLINIFDRTNLIRPATGIGVFQSAYGPRISLYDGLTMPLPSL
jgi:outer membrane receptor protein involved in Fe transport